MIAAALVAAILAAAPTDARAAKCSYVAKAMRQEAVAGMAPRGICGHFDAAGVLHADTAALRSLDRDGSGLGTVFVEGEGWFYVTRGGRTARVPAFDNGPDEFSEGLVRTLVAGRIGYVDLQLEPVVAPRFDFGWPFEDGRARVCLGCALSPPDDDGHRAVEGGLWGYVDRSGREVVPIRYSREEVDRAATATSEAAPPLEKAEPEPTAPRRLAARLPDGSELAVEVCDEECEACWSLVRQAGTSEALGCGLAALHHVVSITPSPDGRWLAVMTVGEGHPMLEIVDLAAFRERRDYRVLATINPYPGMVDIEGWREDALHVRSDMPLPRLLAGEEVSLDDVMADVQTFALAIGTWAASGPLADATAAAEPLPAAAPDPLAVARKVMSAARYATFVTLGEDGRAESRIVDPFPPEDDMTVWIATRPVTRKVAQIGRDPRVTLTYWDRTSMGYVTLLGDATLVEDPAEKARRWKPEWKDFYSDANRGADYVLIRVRPVRLEVLSPADGILNDPLTWRPVQHLFP